MGGQASDELNLRDLAGVLRARWRVVFLVFLICVIAAAAATALLPIRYFAAALVFVDVSRKDLLDPTYHTLNGNSESARVDSEVEILGSDGVLMQTIQSEALVEDPEFNPPPGMWRRLREAAGEDAEPFSAEIAAGLVLARIRDAISVHRRGQTHVISVGVRSRDAAKAARLATALAHTYIANQLNTKIGNLRAARDIIALQAEEARASLIRAETAFGRFVFDNLDEIVALSGRAELREKQQRIAALAAERQELANQLTALRERIGAQNRTVFAEAATFQPPKVTEPARFKLDEGDLTVALREQASSMTAALDAAEISVATERQALASAVMTTTLPPHILAQLYGLQQAARNETANYQALLARSVDLETQASLQMADSRVVSAALTPASPSFPNVTLVLALACIGGLGLGVISAFVLENMAGGFTSVEQMQSVLGQSLCVALPFEKRPLNGFSVAHAIDGSRSSGFVSAVQRLRTTVDVAQLKMAGAAQLQDATGRVTLVASSVAGEGRSTIALALARTYALSGMQVLIIDGHRGPGSVQRLLGVETASQIGDMSFKQWPTAEDFRAFALKDPHSSAVLVSARTDVRGPTLDPLIAAARQLFDHIIIDGPPVDEIVEGVGLPARADTIVIVARAGRTAQAKVLASIHRLSAFMQSATDPVVVLSQAPKARG